MTPKTTFVGGINPFLSAYVQDDAPAPKTTAKISRVSRAKYAKEVAVLRYDGFIVCQPNEVSNVRTLLKKSIARRGMPGRVETRSRWSTYQQGRVWLRRVDA